MQPRYNGDLNVNRAITKKRGQLCPRFVENLVRDARTPERESMMATAAVTAGFAFAQFFGAGNSTKLDRLADEAMDGFLNVMELFLRFQKAARYGIADEIFAQRFEGGDLFGR